MSKTVMNRAFAAVIVILAVVGDDPSGRAFYIVQGKQIAECLDSTDSKCTSRAVSEYESWNVRCCADTDPGGWELNSDKGCTVYTNSNVPECNTADWSTAVEICTAAGGRLCTRKELEYPNLCSAGGGCKFDNYMVWSSSEGTMSPVFENYYVVHGYSGADCFDSVDPTCSTRVVSQDQRFKVRCCADSDPGGWLKKDGCSVFTESNVPQCVSMDWDSAAEICAAASGRLCTLDELENDCSKDGGCGFNRHMAWSSTVESSQSTTTRAVDTGYYIVQGKQQAKCLDTTDPKCTSRAVSADETWNVRCCADTDPGGWYRNADRDCAVFTSSKVPNCETADWGTAVELCSAAGGRLCTIDELEYPNQCSAGGGCDFDNYMVWSSTVGLLSPAVYKYYIVQGYSKADCFDDIDATCTTRAVSIYERFKVRCCADSDPGGWLQEDGCAVYTESNVPKCVSTDWFSAVDLCSAAGGRLCTREELEADCSKDGGCGFNRHMVWSSTEE